MNYLHEAASGQMRIHAFLRQAIRLFVHSREYTISNARFPEAIWQVAVIQDRISPGLVSDDRGGRYIGYIDVNGQQ